MLKILIADDEMPIRQWFEYVIRQVPNEFRIVGMCSNGQQALQRFELERPDIVITDIRMPVMDGLELIQEIHKRGPNTKFLVLSNYDQFEYVKKGFLFGAKDYLLKGETDDTEIISTLRKIREDIIADGDNQSKPDAQEMMIEDLFRQSSVDRSRWQKVRSYLEEDLWEAVGNIIQYGEHERKEDVKQSVVAYLDWIDNHACILHSSFSESTNTIISYLSRHYDQKLEMKQLSELVHHHENYISQLFKKDTGKSITQYVLEFRMERARLLLLVTKLKIHEIARKVGYNNEAHFCTMFKGHFGKSPTKYLQKI
jgi:YesN/AraC family two-component response regulator